MRAYVATLGDRTRRRQTLRDKDTTLQTQIVVGVLRTLHRLGVIQVDLAVTQLGIINQVLLRPFARRLRHTGNRFALLLGVLNLLQHDLHGLRSFMQVVIELLFDEIVDELVHAHAARRTHIFGTQLHLRLALEHRLLYIDSYRSNNTVADIGQLLILVKELLDGAADRFAESGLVGTSLNSMLAVHKREILIAVLVRVCQSYLDVFTFQMNNWIKRTDGHILRQQVEQTVLRHKFLAVIHQRQAGIQIRIVAQQLLNIVVAEMIVFEKAFAVIGHELDDRTAFLVACVVKNTAVFGQLALRKLRAAGLAFAEGLNRKERTQCVHSFRADTVQTHGFLESFAVVLTARIEHADHLH